MAVLAASAPVTALAGARVGWHARVQGQGLPAVTMHVVSRQDGIAHDGPTGLAAVRVQANCAAETYPEALALTRAVRAALHGFKGAVGGVQLQGVFADGERNLPSGEDAPAPFAEIAMDFSVHYWS